MIDFTRGASRDRLEHDTAADLLQKRTLIPDERRRRPFYFDGRFLTAADLTREQSYFLDREAALGRVGGAGIINGLQVRRTGVGTLEILPGNGITPEGVLVTITDRLTVRLSDLAEEQRLDAAFGIATTPQPPRTKRSGVFLVAIRPVEFTANPITAYPTSLTGPRRVEDGEIVEAVAVTLIPYADETGSSDVARQRATIARDLFLRRAKISAAVNALPLAAISLSQNVLNWVDMFLVRREAGAAHGDTLGLGFSPRALREAQFQQYRQHLTDVLELRKSALQPLKFSATDYFAVLPPAGPMPAAAFDPAAMTQAFFPPQMPVELSVLPEDELRSIVEEALLLPPIDLTLSPGEMESTSILILAPLPRQEIATIEAELQPATRAGVPLPVGPARSVPKLLAGLKPIEALSTLRLASPALPLERRTLPVEERWRAAFSRVTTREEATGLPHLWYVRRRNLAYKATLAGRAQRAVTDNLPDQAALLNAMTVAGVRQRFGALMANFTTMTGRAIAIMVETLARPAIISDVFTLVVAYEIFERGIADKGMDSTEANRIAARVGDPKFGQGYAELFAIQPAFKMTGATLTSLPQRALASAQRVIELDGFFRLLDPERKAKLAASMLPLATANNLAGLNALLDKVLDGGLIE